MLQSITGAMAGYKACFKVGPMLQSITGVYGIVMLVWGARIYNATTEEACMEDDGSMNPRKVLEVYLYVIVAVYATLCGCACCCAVFMAGAAVGGGAEGG